MFAARVKSQLKTAKDRLGAKRYQDALDAVNDALHYEPGNTTALLYKAAALQNLAVSDAGGDSGGQDLDFDCLNEAREALELATKIKPDLAPAWIGLEKIYEKLGETDALVAVLERLLDLFYDSGDSKRLTDALSKLIALHLSPDSFNLALADDTIRLQLPGTRIFDKLASPPSPLDIWRQLVELHETEDERKCNRLVAQRRALIGAPPEPVVRAAVEAEVAVAASRRVTAYENVLALMGDDALDSDVVTKYLSLLQTQAATGQVKDAATKMNAWVDKCIASNTPILLAYQIALDNTDIHTVNDYPIALLEPLSRLTATAVQDADRDYALAAMWILTQTEPADLSADPSSLFPAIVSAFLSDDDPIVLAASRTALALITARKPRTYPHTTLALRLRRAEVFIRSQQSHNARAELDAVADALDESDAASQLRAHQVRGDAALLLKEPHVARNHFARAVDLAPVSPSDPTATWVHASLAWVDFQLANVDAATTLTALTSLDPTALAPTQAATHHYRVARAAYAAHAYDQAYAHLLAAAQRAPTAVPAVFTYLGRVFSEVRHDPQRAAKCWTKALALDPADDEAGVLLAEFHVREHRDWVAAAAVLEGVTRVKPRAYLVWKRLGLVRMAQEKWEEAVVALQFAVRTMPAREQEAHVWSALGEAYIQLGRWATAVKALKQAHALDTGCPTTRYLLAQAHFKLSQFLEATAYLSDTDSSPCAILAGQVHLHHALAAFQAGRYKESAHLLAAGIAKLEVVSGDHASTLLVKALADLRTAWSIIPHLCTDLPSQLQMAADEYESVGLFGESGAAWLRLAQSSSPADPDALAKAQNMLMRAITATPATIPRDAPHLAPVWTALGVVYALQGSPRRTQHCFVVALRGNPTSSTVWANLAALYIAYGDTPLAVEALERAVSADAEHPDPWVLRAMAEPSAAVAHIAHAATSGLWMSPQLAQAVSECPDLRAASVAPDLALHVEVAARMWTEWNPSDPAAWNALACAYERAGNAADAVDAMKRAVKLMRGELGLVGNLARMLAGSEPARAVDLLKRIPPPPAPGAQGAWGHWLVQACAEHASQGAALANVLAACLAEIHEAPDDAKHLLAQLMYKAGVSVDRIEPLVAHSAPDILCALGMLTGNEELVAAGFARASPAEAHYLASIHHVLQGELGAAQRALERALHLFPGNSAAVARLVRFLARYSPNRAQVAIAESMARREMAKGDPTTALGLAATSLLAVGSDVEQAVRMAQRQVMARPSQVKAWTQLGVAVLAARDSEVDAAIGGEHAMPGGKMVARLAAYSLAADPESPFSHLLASAGALAMSDPVQAMQHAEQAVALISSTAGADALPNVVFRQLARVLLSNGEADAALGMLKRALDAPAGADMVAQAVRAGAILDLAHLYVQVGLKREAIALVVDAAENDAHLPASGKIVLMAYASALSDLDLGSVQQAIALTREMLGGEGEDGEGADLSHPLLEQAHGLLALATFQAGSKGKGAKLMSGVRRSDIVHVFASMGGTIQPA